ncbi:DUF397 domain-containing protein [Streptomyces sp. DT2A-34]|uniref:DUF397 domain-containing protein n=1 Tax=Streptomyces sp. DT2A-34 TaxID=3051182 RepID=UPI00265C0F26|nr:DUF397 domain-containing protein [Streptomyces sp. DT2A-34]MDO0913942.1 DUF397 domain-containing protein [Streptomyces sp. DT2A-34]
MIRNASAGNASELAWFKSSYSSGSEGDSCVEIAPTPATIHIRDSKYRDTSPRLALAPQAWSAFVTYASEGSA